MGCTRTSKAPAIVMLTCVFVVDVGGQLPFVNMFLLVVAVGKWVVILGAETHAPSLWNNEQNVVTF